MLVPFYMLEGNINVVKEINLNIGCEIVYRDDNGNTAIIYIAD